MIPAPALVAAFVFSDLIQDGFTDVGQDLEGREHTVFAAQGYFRTRGELLYDLDLDRGPTPSGQLFFPLPLSEPSSHLLDDADMRLRADLAAYAPFGGLAVKVRLDGLNNLQLGSLPQGSPQSSTSYQSPSQVILIRRAYGEVLTPVGLLAAGRMGNQFGLGMTANSGDCLDCDYDQSADRILFATPLVGYIWALAFDFTAAGPLIPKTGGTTLVGLDPSTEVHTFNVAVLKWHDADAIERRRRAHLTTFDYGAYYSHRWQNDDVPADYILTSEPVAITPSQVVPRGYQADAIDGWARLLFPEVRLEAEAAFLYASEQQASLIPGVLLPQAVTATQWGGAFESEVGAPNRPWGVGLDTGIASGDSAPGFGALVPPGAAAAKPGDLNGAQASPPYDYTVNNFQFSPDYHIDRILFRNIIGTVTDAYYLRPHARLTLAHSGKSRLSAELFGVASWALYASSTPGGTHALGLEVDPTLRYESSVGFVAELQYAVLFPFSGLDNPQLDLTAQPAQLGRLLLAYEF
ncbi:MAG TPA: TIGR04551 family protein [Myxococcales bacterium]|nr:TIGR04551 family protein [Myxococcales bacterium]